MVGAYQAVSLGMADRVGTLAETIDSLFNKNVASLNAASESDKPEMNRQEPVVDNSTQRFMQAHLARVEKSKQFVLQGDAVMNLRELMKTRSEKLARAEQLAKLADAEGRDFTEDERKEFETLLGKGDGDTGEIGALDAQIKKITDERSRLRAAMEAKLGVASDAEKPDGSVKKVMKRSEFEKLDASAQTAFIRDGGKLED